MANRALLVGINAYPGQPLRGCINDITDMAKFLTDQCQFVSDDIRLLVDDRATTQGIYDRLGWLLTGLHPGDRILFQYSGHGTLYARRNPQGQVIDQQDAIVPVDFDWSRDRFILATDFQKLFATIPAGVDFVFVSDSCNSGDLAKALKTYTPRFLLPPADMAWRLSTAAQKGLEVTTMRSVMHDNCAFVSGCRSDQESADASFDGRFNGALTYYLLKTLKAAGYLKQPLKKVVPVVVQQLAHNNYPQVPQLHGPDDLVSLPFLGGFKKSALAGPGVGKRRVATISETGIASRNRGVARKRKTG